VLLKTLLSNACINDCKYCTLRAESSIRRCTLRPEEVARVFMEYQRGKKVFGLFLSSGVVRSPDYTMDRINAVARLLRKKYHYRGYIHLKIIPCVSDAAIEDSISLASAVSLNIETPGKKHFAVLSDKKNYDRDIIHPLKLMSRLTGRGMKYSRVKCTTQFIVGASDEKDSDIMRYMAGLYERLKFRRVYFSAHIPGERHFLVIPEERFMREHRLYQTDFLMRKYGFKSSDIPLDQKGNLRLDKDPKQVWADHHPEYYPVRLNTSAKDTLLKVPGLGPLSVSRILTARKEGQIRSLEQIGVRGRRLDLARKYVVAE
jgi:predicted DNA-binding helix-hairpin-helix protein